MAALTQDKVFQTRGTGVRQKVAIKTSATVYRGGFGSIVPGTGRLKASAAAAGEHFGGLIVDFDGPTGGTGVGNASGTEYAIIEYGNEVKCVVKTAYRTNTFLNFNMFVSNDQEIGGTAVGTSAARQVAGELTAFEASDKSTAWLALRRGGLRGSVTT